MGQLVAYHLPASGDAPEVRRSYKILQVLPPDGAEYIYRVKSITEANHRAAKEAEIELF